MNKYIMDIKRNVQAPVQTTQSPKYLDSLSSEATKSVNEHKSVSNLTKG